MFPVEDFLPVETKFVCKPGTLFKVVEETYYKHHFNPHTSITKPNEISFVYKPWAEAGEGPTDVHNDLRIVDVYNVAKGYPGLLPKTDLNAVFTNGGQVTCVIWAVKRLNGTSLWLEQT